MINFMQMEEEERRIDEVMEDLSRIMWGGNMQDLIAYEMKNLISVALAHGNADRRQQVMQHVCLINIIKLFLYSC